MFLPVPQNTMDKLGEIDFVSLNVNNHILEIQSIIYVFYNVLSITLPLIKLESV